MYLHCLACIWFLVVSQDNVWIPPLDYLHLETTLYESTTFYQYWTSLYHSVLLLTGNDVGPRGNFQVRTRIAPELPDRDQHDVHPHRCDHQREHLW